VLLNMHWVYMESQCQCDIPELRRLLMENKNSLRHQLYVISHSSFTNERPKRMLCPAKSTPE